MYKRGTTPFPKLFFFVQIGWVPRLPNSGTLTDRGKQIRYICIEYDRYVLVQTINVQTSNARTVDFHPIYRDRDPLITNNNFYATFKQKLINIRKLVKIGTPPPVPETSGPIKPDTKPWANAHDNSLAKMDQEGVVYRSDTIPIKSKQFPLTMTCNYKWKRDGKACQIKALFSLLGDLIWALHQYDKSNSQFPTTETATARMQFAVAVSH